MVKQVPKKGSSEKRCSVFEKFLKRILILKFKLNFSSCFLLAALWLLIWKSFFTRQLPLNTFPCYFEDLLRITSNLVNFLVNHTSNHSHAHVPT